LRLKRPLAGQFEGPSLNLTALIRDYRRPSKTGMSDIDNDEARVHLQARNLPE